MAYSATYTSGDADDVIIDLLVTVFVAMVAFGTLIGLIAVYNFFRGKGFSVSLK